MYQNILEPARTVELAGLVRGSVELAARLGVGVVGCFAGRILNEPLEASLSAFKKVWSELAKHADGQGVRIAFENCPHGQFHQPDGGNNFLCTPEMWERAFHELPMENLGLQWDPSHLVCMQIDVMGTLTKFGPKIFSVHAKDARIDRDIVARHGLRHEGATTHCFPGLGESDWGAIVSELKRQGYDGGLDIEGWHDPIYCGDREDEGLLIALRHLRQAGA
jgi:sugar phosphate isomerase/epimerase